MLTLDTIKQLNVVKDSETRLGILINKNVRISIEYFNRTVNTTYTALYCDKENLLKLIENTRNTVSLYYSIKLDSLDDAYEILKDIKTDSDLMQLNFERRIYFNNCENDIKELDKHYTNWYKVA